MNENESLPIVRCMAEAELHDKNHRAFVDMPGRWVLPAIFLAEHERATTPEGAMARALENIIVGVLEHRIDLISVGITHTMMAAAKLVGEIEGT